MSNKTKRKVIDSPVAFGSFLALGVVSTLALSPVTNTFADTTANVQVNATVNSEIAITVSANELNFAFTPTAAGTFTKKTVTATVDTNSTGGYELYFSSEDANTAMTSLVSQSTIASDFSGTVTSSTMANNKWGYSTDGTNFSKIPVLASPATVKNIDHVPTSSEKDTTINVGIKVNSDLPSGTYSKTVKFTAVAHATPEP